MEVLASELGKTNDFHVKRRSRKTAAGQHPHPKYRMGLELATWREKEPPVKILFLLAALVTLVALMACGEPTPTQEVALTDTPESTVTPDAHSGVSPWTQCRDNAITSRLPGTGGHVRADTDSGGTLPGPDTCTGDPDTGTNVYPDFHGDGPSTDKERSDAGPNGPEAGTHVGTHEAKGNANTNADAADQHTNPGAHPNAGPNG